MSSARKKDKKMYSGWLESMNKSAFIHLECQIAVVKLVNFNPQVCHLIRIVTDIYTTRI